MAGDTRRPGIQGATQSDTDQEILGLRKHDCQVDLLEFKVLGTGQSLKPFELESDRIETR